MKFTQPQALDLWRQVLAKSLAANGADLTARQMLLLLTVYRTEGPHTVRGLAAALGISKPAVTRALDRLGQLELARRKRDEADRRNVLVQRTVKGSVFLADFATTVGDLADTVTRPAQ
jgi:DNA-binding MarR family transcriptional regulator